MGAATLLRYYPATNSECYQYDKNRQNPERCRGATYVVSQNGRDLPWRKTTDPYAIVVSEVMLQQTQVDRVIPKYHAFLAKFPDWRHLAKASQASVVKMWHGLGYNRRAMMLHRLGGEMTRDVERSPEMPKELDELVKLPGIGAYTAQAVRAFAFRCDDAAPVDTNIERILKRVFGSHDKNRKQSTRSRSMCCQRTCGVGITR